MKASQQQQQQQHRSAHQHLEVKSPLGLAVLLFVLTVLAPVSDRVFYQLNVLMLVGIAGAYIGFAALGSTWKGLVVEMTSFQVFLGLAFYSLNADMNGDGALVLSLGYFLHGVWDVLHHRSWNVTPVDVSSWYPPFCLYYDVAIALYILWRFWW